MLPGLNLPSSLIPPSFSHIPSRRMIFILHTGAPNPIHIMCACLCCTVHSAWKYHFSYLCISRFLPFLQDPPTALLGEGFPDSQAHTNLPTHLYIGNSLLHLDSVIYVHVLSFGASCLFAPPQPSPRCTLCLSLPCSMLWDILKHFVSWFPCWPASTWLQFMRGTIRKIKVGEECPSFSLPALALHLCH